MLVPQTAPPRRKACFGTESEQALDGEISIEEDDLRAGTYYWARRVDGTALEIVQVTDIFGSGREFWSVATIGSDQHHSLREFKFLIRLMKP